MFRYYVRRYCVKPSKGGWLRGFLQNFIHVAKPVEKGHITPWAIVCLEGKG